ncbi:MAG: AI-2E family transporter [Rhizobiaceae bacterium]
MNAPERWRRGTTPMTNPMDNIVSSAARLSLIAMGVIAVTAALDFAQLILAPVVMAVVIGLMFGPIADRLERAGLPPALSAALLVPLFILLAVGIMTSIAVPLSEWSRQLPVIWNRLQAMAANWRELLVTLDGLRDSIRSAIGDVGAMEVQVNAGSTVEHAAWLAPTIFMQIVLFLVSFYFFIATRHGIRVAVLSLCFERRFRWRVAHIFRDVEAMVSRYLLSITAVNIGLAIAVSATMWALGVPSPLLWGVLAGVLNYIVYVGPAIMAVILLCVGLATGDTTFATLAPAGAYLCLNLLESQLVTPHVIGRAVTLNPFLVFLAIGFWIWIWGPVGGFIAVPVLLIMAATIRHVIPGIHRRQAMLTNKIRH